MGRLLPPVDITNEQQLKELDKRIKMGPMTLVLVYADWCGHCQRFKPMMDQLEGCKERSIQTARIRDDMFPKSSISNTKLEGYPSVLLVKENGEVASFKKPSGEVTNAIPNHTDMQQMTAIVKNIGTANGQSLLETAEEVGSVGNTGAIEPVELSENSVIAGNTATGNLATAGIPKNILADRLSPENVNRLNSALVRSSNSLLREATAPVVKQTQAQTGGSLFSSLMMASKGLAPAAALFLGAEAMRSRRGRSLRKTRRVRKQRSRK
jgi:thiol-disulfide isomerase/thioredoxin